MIKVEFLPSVNLTKFRIDPRQLEDPLSNLAEQAVLQHGCQHCQSRNLTVYINEVERTEIRGLYYCHDCNRDGTFTAQHNLIDTYEEIGRRIQDALKKGFSG